MDLRFDSETTQQASEWRFKNEPRPKKARKAPSKVKVMLTVFFDYQGIVHHEFQQQGSTITADSYLGVLSPDLAPCDFLLFGKLKKKLKGRKFQSIEEIKVESKKAMKAIPKTDYQRCFADWKKRWLKCIAANRDYFKGDNLNLGLEVEERDVNELIEEHTQELTTEEIQELQSQQHTEVMQVIGFEESEEEVISTKGRQNVHDDERSGRPVTATDNAAVAAARNVVEADRRVTIDEIMIRLPPGIEIGRSSIRTIMSDVLNFRKVCARWVPRLLLENHKQQRMEAARAFLEMHQRDGDQLFSRIVTGDESWVHHSTPETKRQSMVWKKPEESAPKKAKVPISAGKVMAMENFKWEIFTHPPYSPELAPSDFHLFPALK
ncbi:hypothetical protein LAZ67_21002278 [Cordylochernes scorpioides]|uniref:Histone-lysine N-methyltransferase SETMAR n=1 Tax=Cordylochernes scorpioides TaxID=51811 RepID=A0ABY6LMX6_9ARAC|nr:hypothetical protein LAZ67_21002278 [Cordylochernes scorpioides]